MISVPLAIYSIVNLPSFNTKEKAGDLTLDVDTCQIRFPYINPGSIEVNKIVQVSVSADTPQEAITKVSVMDRSGAVVFSKEYTDGRDRMAESFTINPKEEGGFGLLGTLITDKGTRPCVIESKRQVMVVSANTAPEFKTQSTSAKPSNAIKVNDSYSYQLEATDLENDNINFAFSFTPNATWLKSTVIENGTGGKLSIKFSGAPDKPGSYLANIFIHDGYNAHLRAQTWVISVDQDKNDVPKVSVIKPATDVSINIGDKITVSWEGADLNRITKYELYIATNPGNENSWIAINKEISPKVGNYIVDTKSFKSGVYQFIVRAYDNYTPPASGTGFSAKVTIGDAKPVDPNKPDDGVVLQEAQIINLSPTNESSIKNKNAVISATLVPSKEATVKKESIVIKFDDKDITSKARISEGTDGTYSVAYTPETPHSEGIHKVQVSFEDSKTAKATKDWTFTVIPEDQNTDVIKIFGFEIPKRLATIVAAGLAILLLALIVPWLLYLAWRGTKEENDYEDIYRNTVPIEPEPNQTFVEKKYETIKETKIENEEKPLDKKILTPIFTFNKVEPKKEEKIEFKVEPTPIVNEIKVEQPRPFSTSIGKYEPKMEKVEVKVEPTPIVNEIKVEEKKIETPKVSEPIIKQDIKISEPVEIAPITTPTPISEPIEPMPVTNIVENTNEPVIEELQPEASTSSQTPVPEVVNEPVAETTNVTEPAIINMPVVETTEDLNKKTVVEEVAEEIEDTTNKELEALAAKLRAKEEIIEDFTQTPTNSAPSSLPVDKNTTQNQ